MVEGNESHSQLANEILLLREENRRLKAGPFAGTDLHALFEHVNCALCMAAFDGTILYANSFFASVHSLPWRECVGRKLEGFIHPRHAEELRVLFTGLAGGHSYAAVSLLHVDSGGEAFPMLCSLFPSPDIGDSPGTIVMIALQQAAEQTHDIVDAARSAALDSVSRSTSSMVSLEKLQSELVECKDRLRKQGQELEQKNAALHELMSQLRQDEDGKARRSRAALLRTIGPLLTELRKACSPGEAQRLARLEKAILSFAIEPGDDGQAFHDSLSPREMEVCELIGRGLSTKEIAARLAISSKSVQTHRNHIRKKLGMLNRGINLKSFLRDSHSI